MVKLFRAFSYARIVIGHDTSLSNSFYRRARIVFVWGASGLHLGHQGRPADGAGEVTYCNTL